MHLILSFCSNTISLFTTLGFILYTSVQVHIDLQTILNLLLHTQHKQVVVLVVLLPIHLLVLVQVLQCVHQQLTLFPTSFKHIPTRLPSHYHYHVTLLLLRLQQLQLSDCHHFVSVLDDASRYRVRRHDIILINCSSLVLVDVVSRHLLVVLQVNLEELAIVFPHHWSLAHFFLQVLEQSVDALSVGIYCSLLFLSEKCHFKLEHLDDSSQHFIRHQVQLHYTLSTCPSITSFSMHSKYL